MAIQAPETDSCAIADHRCNAGRYPQRRISGIGMCDESHDYKLESGVRDLSGLRMHTDSFRDTLRV